MDPHMVGDAPLHRQVEALRRIVRSDQVLDGLLVELARLGLPNWYVGAGTVAAALWNWCFGLDPVTAVKDYDVVFYDSDDTTSLGEKTAERPWRRLCPRDSPSR